MRQTLQATFAELAEQINKGQVPRDAKLQISWDDAADAIAREEARAALRQKLAEEAERMTPEEWEAEEAIFQQWHHNINETRRELGMREI